MRKEIVENFDKYIDSLQDLNSVSEFNGISISKENTIYVSKGITDLIDALGIEQVETQTTVSDEFVSGKGLIPYVKKWYRFDYRGFRVGGTVAIKPVSEVI